MKNILLLMAFAALSFALHSQNETLFNNLQITGAFGSVIIETGEIVGEIGADVGGGGALMMSPIFIGGYGMGTKYPSFEIKGEENAGLYDIKFGHGGLWIGMMPKEYKLIHLFASTKIGWGKARLRQDKENIFVDRIFVLTPEVGFEVNLTDWLKLGVSAGYRWVNGVTRLPELSNGDFSSPIGILTFRMGGFEDSF